jgi:hypothetical protein
MFANPGHDPMSTPGVGANFFGLIKGLFDSMGEGGGDSGGGRTWHYDVWGMRRELERGNTGSGNGSVDGNGISIEAGTKDQADDQTRSSASLDGNTEKY